MKRASERGKDRISDDNTANADDFVSTTVDKPSDAKWFKIEDDKPKRIDVIPYVAGKNNPKTDEGSLAVKMDFAVHKGVGPNQRNYVCPAVTLGKRCPICEAQQREYNENGNTDYAKSLRPSYRQLYNVIDLDNKGEGVQLWDIALFIFGKQLNAAVNMADDDEDYRYYADPKTGFTLKLGIEKGSFNGKPTYKVIRVDFKERKKQYDKKIVHKAYCLDALLKVPSYKELKKLFEQTPDASEEPPFDSDEDSGKKKKKGKKDMKRKEVTAKSAGIKKGDTVKHEDLGECIVLAVSKDGYTLTLEDEDGDKHKGIGVSEVKGAKEEKKGKGKKEEKKAPPKKGKGKKADDDDEDEDEEDSDDDDDDEDEDDDDDDDEDEDDDDDDEDEEDDDDDDDDEDEEDDDDDDDDDEEEEEKPKKGKGKKGKK